MPHIYTYYTGWVKKGLRFLLTFKSNYTGLKVAHIEKFQIQKSNMHVFQTKQKLTEQNMNMKYLYACEILLKEFLLLAKCWHKRKWDYFLCPPCSSK